MIHGGRHARLKVRPQVRSATRFIWENTACRETLTPDRADNRQTGSLSNPDPRAKSARGPRRSNKTHRAFKSQRPAFHGVSGKPSTITT